MHYRLSCPGNLGEVYDAVLCHGATKKAIKSDRLKSTVILGIEQYDRRKLVEERTIIVRP